MSGGTDETPTRYEWQCTTCNTLYRWRATAERCCSTPRPFGSSGQFNYEVKKMVHSKKIKRILVVDDQEMARKAISTIMEKHGHVDTADTGTDAVSQYAAAVQDGWEYDLVCMDITMPGLLNGFQVVRCIRAHEQKLDIDKPVPVVMISSHTDLASFASEMNMSVDDYIVKPFSQARIEELIQRFLY